jgi:cytochrome P450
MRVATRWRRSAPATATGGNSRFRRYDVDRRPQGHLGFGSGKHFCLGSGMARFVTAIAMKRFLERVPEYHLATTEIAWNSSSNFRSPAALPFVTP